MEAKESVMSDEELDAFCGEVGLSNADWDEGGGFVHEAVVRVIKEARQAGREQSIKEMLGLPKDMRVYKSENIVDEESYKAGIKTVVDWAEDYKTTNMDLSSFLYGLQSIDIPLDEWQNQLKEWEGK